MDEHKDSLLVSEIFGHTIQGEGSSCGVQATFLRLGGCNQHCIWCDTPYTWDWTGKNGMTYDQKKELRWMTFDEIADRLLACSVSPSTMLVVTGGEPLLQTRGLLFFLAGLALHEYFPLRIEIETAGTIWSDCFSSLVHFNVSPKLENSGNPLSLRYHPKVLEQFVKSQHAIFKFVVCSVDDLLEVDQIVADLSIPKNLVWIMPEAKTDDILTGRFSEISETVIDRGYNLSPRFQVELWGNRRGV